MDRKDKVSTTVIRRLPKYHRYLEELHEKGVERISSNELSQLIGFTASQIRQDLNNFGGFGQQGYGYNVKDLQNELSKILGLNRVYNAVVIGAGNLGQALSNYKGFEDVGFKILALADVDKEVVGTEIHDKKVIDFDDLKSFIKEQDVHIGIITVPKEQAQKVADTLVESGVKGIWNFAPVDIEVPNHVIIENVRLNDSLFVLSYFIKEEELRQEMERRQKNK